MAAASGSCFLITGSPGVGKTTLVMRIVESLRASHPDLSIQGFYTREIREGSRRVGFEVVTLDGKRGPLASSTTSSVKNQGYSYRLSPSTKAYALSNFQFVNPLESLGWPCVGKYKVDVASFEAMALPQLEVNEGTDLFIIDEVGKMELFSSSFFPAVLKVLDSNIPILATLPIPKYGHDIPEVSILRNHTGAKLSTLNTGNRDVIKETLYTKIVSLLEKP